MWFLSKSNEDDCSPPVHCSSIAGIQGPSILSSAKDQSQFSRTYFWVVFGSNLKYLVSTYSATVCCTKGFLWTQLLCLIFAAPQDIHNILLRKHTTIILRKQYIDHPQQTHQCKNSSRIAPYSSSRNTQ